jgi:hypothetical protein
MKKGIVSVACQGVCFMCTCCVPSSQQHAYELQRDMGVQSVQQFERSYTVKPSVPGSEPETDFREI